MNKEQTLFFKKRDRILISIPRYKKRTSVIDEKNDKLGEYPTLIGIIKNNKLGDVDEMGFALTIDMTYSGKPDQYTSIIYNYWEGDTKDFKEICKKLDIHLLEYNENE